MTEKRKVVDVKYLKEQRRNVIMKETLIQEIDFLSKKSVELKKTMDLAKTEFKRERFLTKLRRNNNKVFELIQLLERLPETQTVDELIEESKNAEIKV